jgi:hypothetical protein
MKRNQANYDRVFRVIVGLGLIAIAMIWFGLADFRILGVIAGALGLYFTFTGFAGFCPVYAGLGMSTRRIDRPENPGRKVR